ncbi:MAG: MFS transporter [Bdellovibrio sp.]|nr:MAG: MFS transporter [Bdellovibrio sp.]
MNMSKSVQNVGGEAASGKITPYQKIVVAILAFMQFTVILDFMVLSPLGATLMPALKITPTQFGSVVSIYALSAGISGFLAAGFADRFDRKKLLLFFYVGFIAGTMLCALASTFEFLLVARMVTGIFGGVIGSIVFAITTDLFEFEHRGRVLGIIQTSFSASQILGIPFGLWLTNRLNWHAPFWMIVGVGALAGVVVFSFVKPIDAHLKFRIDKKPLHHLMVTMTNQNYLKAFATTALLATGGFMLMPFGSAFSVNNMKIDINDLPSIYLITGLSSMFMGPFLGRISDAVGKYHVFLFGSILTMTMVFIYTTRGVTPLYTVMAINVLLFTGVSARMISSSALVSAIPSRENRGSFMSVSSSIQQLSGGLASLLAGFIVSENPDGSLHNFEMLGYVVNGASVITLVMMAFIHRLVPESEKQAREAS